MKEITNTTVNVFADGRSEIGSSDEQSPSTREHTISSRRGSVAINELIINSLKRTQSVESQKSEMYAIPRMSTSNPSASSVVDRRKVQNCSETEYQGEKTTTGLMCQ